MDKKSTGAVYDARTLGKGKMFVLGFQHMFAMFGATVLVPLLTGLSTSTALFTAGTGTLLYILITGAKVPAFLGSSFAFIPAFADIILLATTPATPTPANISGEYFLIFVIK